MTASGIASQGDPVLLHATAQRLRVIVQKNAQIRIAQLLRREVPDERRQARRRELAISFLEPMRTKTQGVVREPGSLQAVQVVLHRQIRSSAPLRRPASHIKSPAKISAALDHRQGFGFRGCPILRESFAVGIRQPYRQPLPRRRRNPRRVKQPADELRFPRHAHVGRPARRTAGFERRTQTAQNAIATHCIFRYAGLRQRVQEFAGGRSRELLAGARPVGSQRLGRR